MLCGAVLCGVQCVVWCGVVVCGVHAAAFW